MDADKVLAMRRRVHGSFDDYAEVYNLLQSAALHGNLDAVQSAGFDMICSKIARIIVGSPDHIDHWRDIQGYVERILEHTRKKPEATDSSAEFYFLNDKANDDERI